MRDREAGQKVTKNKFLKGAFNFYSCLAALPGSDGHAPWIPFQTCMKRSCPGSCCCLVLDAAGSISQTPSPGRRCSESYKQKYTF